MDQLLHQPFSKPMKDALVQKRVELVDSLQTNLEDLLDYLHSAFPAMDYIRAKNTEGDKVRKLLDDLPTRPGQCFWMFVSALYEQCVGQGAVATQLLKQYEECGGEVVEEVRQLRRDYIDQQHQQPLIPWRPPQHQQHEQQQSHQGQIPHPGQVPHQGQVPQPQGQLPQRRPGTAAATRSDGRQSTEAGDLLASDSYPDSSVESSPMETDAGVDLGCLSMYQQQRHNHRDMVYKMESNPRGLALILNNKNFRYLPHRDGTDADCQMLAELFEKYLGFEVKICHDLRAEDMKKELENFARDLNTRNNISSCMVAIMSHGCAGDLMFGTDGRVVPGNAEGFITRSELREIFSSTSCHGLEGKPKLFIIQACRGNLEDTLAGQVPYYERSGRDVTDESSSDRRPPDGDDGCDTTVENSRDRQPHKSDVIFICATAEGYVAYRNLFIRRLVDVFKMHAANRHVLDLIVFLTAEMKKTQIERHIVTIPQQDGTSSKFWYLNPPSTSSP